MTIEIHDLATPELQRISAQVRRPQLLMQACGRRVANDLKKHFRSRDAEGNSKGWVRSHWWRREPLQATSLTEATATGATVSIASREFAHRLRGGRIQGHPYLAIPLTNQAKAKGSPGEWTHKGDGQLAFIRSRTGACYLFPGEGQSHDASYLLVRSVNQKPDPRALPPREDLESGVDDEATRFLQRTLRK